MSCENITGSDIGSSAGKQGAVQTYHFDSDSDKQLVDSSTIPSDPLLPPTEPVETLASSSVVQQFHLELLDHSESS